MKPLITVVVPHAIAPKWLQICIASMKAFKNDVPYKIIVIDNTPPGMPNGLEALTKTSLGEGIKIIDNAYFLRGHSASYDFVLSFIETPYLFGTETDTQALQDHWLDRFLSKMKDDHVSMAGWYWPGGDREYIHCGGCLYNTAILQRLKKEVQANDNYTICYGTDLKKRMVLDDDIIRSIRDPLHGPFTEHRGFQEIWSYRDSKWYQEPGAWPFYRCRCEYECVDMPGVLLYNRNPHVADGTWFIDNEVYSDPKKEAYFVHHWGGTVSHNWERQRIIQKWEREALPWWVEREDRIWKEVVDESDRKKILDMGLVKTGNEEMEYVLNHPNFKDVKESEII